MKASVSVFFAAALAVAPATAAEPAANIDPQLLQQELLDSRGVSRRIGDCYRGDYLVIAVLGTECPLARLYGPRLEELHDEFDARGVGFVGVNANRQDSLQEIEAYAHKHGISFPLLRDWQNEVVDGLGAKRTPEVFVLDRSGQICYRGRVDDQYGVGYQRNKPLRHDLRAALDELLAGKPVSTPRTEAVGCLIGRRKDPESGAEVTYSKQISRLLQQHCVDCHRQGDIAPFALEDYDEVAGWAEMIAEVVREGRMPPWHADPQHGEFANDRSLTQAQRELIDRWVEAGAPEGDPADLPPPAPRIEGWQLPHHPDLILPVTAEPFAVQAEGAVEYQWFTVDPKLTEDKWLQAAEIRPGNRAVVHHILAFVRNPGETRRFTKGDGYLVGYVPGLRARPFPQGMAKQIPAGSQLVFQVHYTPIGSEQFDQSHIGLVFADPATITHRVQTVAAMNTGFEIPPRAANHRVTATAVRAPTDVLLLSLMPHMHLRGKSFRYELRYADGASETLLDIPRYDFNWQTAYRLREPKTLPEGSRVRCVAHYDNSAENVSNPDPEAAVRWGDQTWEEMMIGYFDIAWPLADGKQAAGPPRLKTDAAVEAEAVIGGLDQDGDDRVSRTECPLKWAGLFLLIDVDRDGFVTLEELTAANKTRREREAARKRAAASPEATF